MSEFWSTLTDKGEMLDAILTGYEGDIAHMPVYSDVIEALQPSVDKTLLDFGCGVGRNLSYLKDHYKSVYGYDFPNMLKNVPRETLKSQNVYVSSSLDDIYSRKYDDILFSLVLQHIHPEELETILTQLRFRASRFIIHSRIWVDFTFEPIMPILEKFFNVDIIDYKEDPNSNENDHFIGVFLPKEL